MFVELLQKDIEVPIVINLRNVIGYWPEDDFGTCILLSNGNRIYVVESYSRITKLVEDQVAAERGY